MSNTQTNKYLAKVRQIILTKLENYNVQVYLFGSRARGDAQITSDVDVAILPNEPLPIGLLSDLRESLFESNIPYQVDLVDLSSSDENFKQRVLKEGIIWNA